MRIRVKFRKYGVMKFIGHLDLMRYFQKCMRRAKIDIVYSKGYSPHQEMSFASPLGVGITSDGEYFDMEVHSTRSSTASIQALNQVMAEGICITSYRRLLDSDKKAMSIAAAADYELRVKGSRKISLADFKAALRSFFYEAEELPVTKKTKKGERTIDLKQLVYDFQVFMEDGDPVFYLKVSTGSTDNVKPEVVLSAFYEHLGEALDPLSVQIHRIDVYGMADGSLASLGEMGEEIA